MFIEPMSDWWRYDNNQEGCHFNTDTQSTISDKLCFQNGIRIKITASDENSYTLAIETWDSFSADTKTKSPK